MTEAEGEDLDPDSVPDAEDDFVAEVEAEDAPVAEADDEPVLVEEDEDDSEAVNPIMLVVHSEDWA